MLLKLETEQHKELEGQFEKRREPHTHVHTVCAVVVWLLYLWIIVITIAASAVLAISLMMPVPHQLPDGLSETVWTVGGSFCQSYRHIASLEKSPLTELQTFVCGKL